MKPPVYQCLSDEELLAIPAMEDRLRALMLEIIQNRFQDGTPGSVAEAVYRTRKRSKLGTREFARRMFCNQGTVYMLESGKSQGSSALLVRIATQAREARMPHTAEYLEIHAGFAKYNSYKRGGKR